MLEYDLEDYLEEVKYQMTLWDYLDEEMILDWEEKAREWVKKFRDPKCRRIIKRGEDVTILIKDEDIFEELARLYYRAKRYDGEAEYWKNFSMLDVIKKKK
ncbi:MAG: hypothetical protein Q4F05_12625 [bacterium]|nr:hypothetical protein [bacterium]